nr:immunoglobulin light chain junction region [Macaca mulatta]MOV75995.1 immunoglobulin light chain junction region [Macaca mulatta]MOV77945.1 immunoglobulin light chain junction region [Macaca mulatta]MOV78316.1 immunoglobulin light chain junction region [Macaca mulatta]MOV78320.1 immunoglobulin light chain junction region [Macaca mulatta]
CMQSLEFPWTF